MVTCLERVEFFVMFVSLICFYDSHMWYPGEVWYLIVFSPFLTLLLWSFLVGGTFKGKNMFPMWSIFFPLIEVPFKMLFPPS